MYKIMILGAGNAQIDLIKYCQRADMEVYCCSYSSHDPGIAFSDHFAKIDVIDKAGIEEFFLENHIDYIYSVGSDIAVPVFSAVAEHTGTPSLVSSRTAEICCDKSRMRTVLKGKPYCPDYNTGSDFEEIIRNMRQKPAWPIEVKPVDSQGQRGISTVSSMEDLRAGFEKSMSYSRKGEVILEEFIEGNEVSVNAYLHHGEIIFSIISDRETWPQYPGGIIHRHHIPSVYEEKDVHEKIIDIVKDTVHTVGLTEGPVYFQIMVRETQPYLIEVTPRLDGCHMWRLIREACGVDLLDMTMNHLRFSDPLRGLDHVPGEIRVPKEKGVHLEFFCQAPGERVDSTSFRKKEAVYRSLYYHDGETVVPMNGYMEKCGYRIYR